MNTKGYLEVLYFLFILILIINDFNKVINNDNYLDIIECIIIINISVYYQMFKYFKNELILWIKILPECIVFF